MYEIEITKQMRDSASEMAESLGHLRNSITKGHGNYAGFLGEQLANTVIRGKIEHTYDYDIVDPIGITVDVKTKRTTVTPMPHYNCSVADFNTKQLCDFYCFVRVHESYDIGWFLGVYPKNKFYTDATFGKKGSPDGPDFKFRADCYNIRIDQLLLPRKKK